MKRILILLIALITTASSACAEGTVTTGNVEDRGFVLDNVLHDEARGDIHFSLYVPDSYDGSRPVPLYVALPGWEGLYFQGVGADLKWETMPFAARGYDPDMIIASAQLNDWGMTSAQDAVALTEYLMSAYNVDPNRVYLSGYSGGGETGSLVMELHPELYAAYLMMASQWDGELEPLAEGLGNSIIIYFDYSENIVTDGLDVDAVSSASVAEGQGVRDIGNLLVMVDLIEQRSGAPIYPLHITEKYAPMYMDMVDGARADKENDRQFNFEESLPDLSDVDTVFFGSPIWWYDMPQPVVNFFQQVDLSGKRFMYFSINRGSGNSGVIERLKELQPGLTVAAEYSLDAMQTNESAAEEFNAWLDSLGK